MAVFHIWSKWTIYGYRLPEQGLVKPYVANTTRNGGQAMSITDSRYDRDRLRLTLAYRLIAFEARTRTIRLATQLSDDRIRKLYRDYFQGRGGIPVKRRRGKSPRQMSFFRRSLEHEHRPACSVRCCACATCSNARRLPTAEPRSRGALLRRLRDVHRALCLQPHITFEHAWHLWQMLSRADEFVLSTCQDCDVALVAGHARHPARQLRGLPARVVPHLKRFAALITPFTRSTCPGSTGRARHARRWACRKWCRREMIGCGDTARGGCPDVTSVVEKAGGEPHRPDHRRLCRCRLARDPGNRHGERTPRLAAFCIAPFDRRAGVRVFRRRANGAVVRPACKSNRPTPGRHGGLRRAAVVGYPAGQYLARCI